jgi:hypothetical protein
MADVPTHSCLAIGLVCDEEPNGYGYLDSDPNLSISSGVGVRELEGDEAIGGWSDIWASWDAVAKIHE